MHFKSAQNVEDRVTMTNMGDYFGSSRLQIPSAILIGEQAVCHGTYSIAICGKRDGRQCKALIKALLGHAFRKLEAILISEDGKWKYECLDLSMQV